MQPHVPPTVGGDAFNCPHCGVYANQWWQSLAASVPGGASFIADYQVDWCLHCENVSIWHTDRVIHPDTGAAPMPNPDMPENVRQTYEEARGIAGKSPRAAAALLRVCIEEMVYITPERGKDLNATIGNLHAANKIETHIKDALDVVRVIGNDAVHSGTIQERDDPETVSRLFVLVNLIAHRLFTRERELAEMVELLPKSARDAIAGRDSK